MLVRTLAGFSFALLLFCVMASKAQAELELSLEIRGSMDEIMTVLQQLQQSGFGKPGEAAGDGLKLEVHSTADAGATPAPGDAATPPAPEVVAPEPPLALKNTQVQPAVVAAGEVLRVSVEVRDDARLVDTVAANMHSAEKEFTFDLFDNGSHGDTTAGDGVWSVNVAVPGAASPGEYALTLYAYDAAGTRLTLPNAGGEAVSVSAEAALTVKP